MKGIGEADDSSGSPLKDIPGQAAIWLEVTSQSRALCGKLPERWLPGPFAVRLARLLARHGCGFQGPLIRSGKGSWSVIAPADNQEVNTSDRYNEL